MHIRTLAGRQVEITYLTPQCTVVRVLPWGVPVQCRGAAATSLYLLQLEERLNYEACEVAAWNAFVADYRRHVAEEIDMQSKLEFYDGDLRHEGKAQQSDYVLHECDVSGQVVAVRKGTACPNRRFGCGFIALDALGRAARRGPEGE